ncbi:MAG: hypothetical protein WDO71_16385 [Bacteroidota bacterium]
MGAAIIFYLYAEPGMDGRFGGMEQGSGAYVWMAEGVTMDNKLISKKGSVI